jgi:predicted nucleic acid-binding protein
MPETRESIYWDACLFLAYVNNEEDRVSLLEDLLDSDTNEIYTSAISHVEVAFAASEKEQKALDLKIEERIGSLWSDTNAVESIEYHEEIGQLAKGLMREAITSGWSLKPLDAIHLATAQWLLNEGIEIQEFHTYDLQRLKKYESLVGFRIVEPHTLQSKMF